MPRSCRWSVGALVVVLSSCSCGDGMAAVDGGGLGADAGVSVTAAIDYGSTEFWAAPFPDERLRTDGGTIDVSGFPNPPGVALVDQVRSVLASADGFGASSTIFFPMSGAIDPRSLPDMSASLWADASVFHEIMFQLPAAQLQYRCFLETMLAGPPRIQPPAATGCN